MRRVHVQLREINWQRHNGFFKEVFDRLEGTVQALPLLANERFRLQPDRFNRVLFGCVRGKLDTGDRPLGTGMIAITLRQILTHGLSAMVGSPIPTEQELFSDVTLLKKREKPDRPHGIAAQSFHHGHLTRERIDGSKIGLPLPFADHRHLQTRLLDPHP